MKNLSKIKKDNKELNEKEFRIQKTILKSLPVQAWISISGKCNLKCLHCPSRIYDIKYKEVMSNEMFSKIEKELFPTLIRCRIGGNNVGEQLLPDKWDEYFEIMIKYDFSISLITNGHALTKSRIKRLVESGCYIDISIDGATEETYKKIRGVSLSRLKEKIRLIVEERSKIANSNCRIKFSFTAMQQNIHELPDLIILAHTLGVDEVMVMHFIPFDETQRFQSLFYHQTTANENFKKAFELAQKYGIKIFLPPLYKIGYLNNKDKIKEPMCHHPWKSVSINEKGEVFPCCVSEMLLGDLNKSSLLEIWNNKQYQKLRKTVNSSHPPKDCKNCILRGNDFSKVDYPNLEAYLKHINLPPHRLYINSLKKFFKKKRIVQYIWSIIQKF